jgi:hypothetical protein
LTLYKRVGGRPAEAIDVGIAMIEPIGGGSGVVGTVAVAVLLG